MPSIPAARLARIKPTRRAFLRDPQGYGSTIYAYRHIRTNQVVYSMTRTLDSNKALKQLPPLGRNTVPPTLRKDHWKPFYTLALPSTNPIAGVQGREAFRQLREYRRLHELYWEPPEEMSRNYTKEEREEIQKKLDQRGGSKKESVYDIIKREKKKLRQGTVMNQKANSVADLAAVLQQMKGKGEVEREDSWAAWRKRRAQEVREIVELSDRAKELGLDKNPKANIELPRKTNKELMRERERMLLALKAVKSAHRRMEASSEWLLDLKWGTLAEQAEECEREVDELKKALQRRQTLQAEREAMGQGLNMADEELATSTADETSLRSDKVEDADEKLPQDGAAQVQDMHSSDAKPAEVATQDVAQLRQLDHTQLVQKVLEDPLSIPVRIIEEVLTTAQRRLRDIKPGVVKLETKAEVFSLLAKVNNKLGRRLHHNRSDWESLRARRIRQLRESIEGSSSLPEKQSSATRGGPVGGLFGQKNFEVEESARPEGQRERLQAELELLEQEEKAAAKGRPGTEWEAYAAIKQKYADAEAQIVSLREELERVRKTPQPSGYSHESFLAKKKKRIAEMDTDLNIAKGRLEVLQHVLIWGGRNGKMRGPMDLRWPDLEAEHEKYAAAERLKQLRKEEAARKRQAAAGTEDATTSTTGQSKEEPDSPATAAVANESSTQASSMHTAKAIRRSARREVLRLRANVPYYDELLPSFPPVDAKHRSILNSMEARLADAKNPSHSLEGVRIQWADMLDAEYAAEWPEEVQHEPMGLVRNSAKPVDFKPKLDVWDLKSKLRDHYIKKGLLPPSAAESAVRMKAVSDDAEQAEMDGTEQLDLHAAEAQQEVLESGGKEIDPLAPMSAEEQAQAEKCARRQQEQKAKRKRSRIVEELAAKVLAEVKRQPKVEAQDSPGLVRRKEELEKRRLEEERRAQRAMAMEAGRASATFGLVGQARA